MKRKIDSLAVGASLLFAVASAQAAGAAAGVISADQLIELYSSVPAATKAPVTRGVRGIAGVRTGGVARHDTNPTQPQAIAQASPTQQRKATKATALDAPVHAVSVQPRQAFHNIEFRSGSATISAASYAQLDEIGAALAVVMKRDPAKRFVVEGHTDSVGDLQRNDELSKNRARAIRRFLVIRHDLDGSRIDVVGHGARHPVASNASEQGRRLNRRVEIVARS